MKALKQLKIAKNGEKKRWYWWKQVKLGGKGQKRAVSRETIENELKWVVRLENGSKNKQKQLKVIKNG